jgi:hypothetical protein
MPVLPLPIRSVGGGGGGHWRAKFGGLLTEPAAFSSAFAPAPGGRRLGNQADHSTRLHYPHPPPPPSCLGASSLAGTAGSLPRHRPRPRLRRPARHRALGTGRGLPDLTLTACSVTRHILPTHLHQRSTYRAADVAALAVETVHAG